MQSKYQPTSYTMLIEDVVDKHGLEELTILTDKEDKEYLVSWDASIRSR